MYKTVQINWLTKVFYVTAYPCVSTSVPLTCVWAFGFVGCILFFEAKLVLQSLRSVIRTMLKNLQTLQYCVVPILGTLFLKTLLDTCSSGPCLGTCSLGALLGNLFLGAKGGLKFVYRNLVWESVLAELASKPCFQPLRNLLGNLI